MDYSPVRLTRSLRLDVLWIGINNKSIAWLAGAVMAFAAIAVGMAPAIASAQIRLVPDLGEHSMLGPALAEGVVIWSHGRSTDSEDSKAPTPPYIEEFRRRGWDAFRLNRMRVDDTLARSSVVLAKATQSLKHQGYRRVALAGQSFGAFISLMAAADNSGIDAVIATAPAAFGPRGDVHGRYKLNASKLYPVLKRLRHARVMLFYFSGDTFDPGGRGARSEEILADDALPHLVIDRPPQFTTHWAASTPAFAATFGSCIISFTAAAAARDANCDAVPTLEKVPSNTITASRPPAPAFARGERRSGNSGQQ